MIHLDRFMTFVRLQLATGDYDAHIPFLRGLCARQGLGKERSLWLGLLYMAYYSEGSAWAAYLRPGVPSRMVMPPLDLPITTQRRNLYGGRLQRHLTDVLAIRPTLTAWCGVAADWHTLTALVRGLWGNGRWATYTTSELLTHLGGPAVQPTCYDVLDSSGPRKGLAALGLQPSEAAAEQVRQALLDYAGIDVPMSVLESLLCDWAGMNKGTFYAGRNIDRQQARILDVERRTGCRLTTLWLVRRQVFPLETLGELRGREGVDRRRLKAYKESGAVLAPAEGR